MKSRFVVSCVIALYVGLVSIFAEASSGKIFPVNGLAYPATASDLDRVRHEYDRTVVMFFAPWCSACEQLKPKYHEAAESFRHIDKVRFLLVDATADVALSLQFDIQ